MSAADEVDSAEGGDPGVSAEADTLLSSEWDGDDDGSSAGPFMTQENRECGTFDRLKKKLFIHLDL